MSETEASMEMAPQTLGRRPGAILGAERQKQGLSLEQAAEQLKLAPRQITALEQDDYANLPGMTIVRGFVRAYAKLLKLDAAPLVAMIEVEGSLAAQNPVRVSSARFAETPMPSQRSRSMTPLLIGGSALMAVLVAGLAWWMQPGGSKLPMTQVRESASAIANASTPAASAAPLPNTVVTTLPSPLPGAEQSSAAVADGASQHAVLASATPAPLPSQTATAPTPTQFSSPTPSAAPHTTPTPSLTPQSSPTPLSKPSASPTPVVAAATPTPASGGNQLVLKLNQDSWIEVRKVNGPVLLSRLVKAGSTESFDAANPLQLVVGNVNGVEASLRGAALNLKNGAGNTARLTVK